MSDAADHDDTLPLRALERALRPLRRVLALDGADRAGVDDHFAANLARLALPLAALELPPPLDETAEGIVSALASLAEVSDDARVARAAEAWQGILSLDATLGLPLDDETLYRKQRRKRPRRRRRSRSTSESADTASASTSTSASKDAPKPEVPSGPSPADVEPAEPKERPHGHLAISGNLAWESPLAELGLPEGPVEAVATLGVRTVRDLLTLAPRSEQVLAPVHGAGRRIPAGPVAVGGRVRARFTVLGPDGTCTSVLRLTGAGCQDVIWHQPFSALDRQRLTLGAKVVVVGEAETVDTPRIGGVSVAAARLRAASSNDEEADAAAAASSADEALDQATVDAAAEASDEVVASTDPAPEATEASVAEAPEAAAPRVVVRGGRLARSGKGRAHLPTYADGEAGEAARELLMVLLPRVSRLEDPLPASVASRHRLTGLDDAVSRLHTSPSDPVARRRLGFDEALHVQLGLSAARFEGGGPKGLTQGVVHGHVSDLAVRGLGEALTDTQQALLEDVKRDLRAPRAMSRLLTGDAASGLHDVVLHALLTVAEDRHQVLLIAPDAPSAAVLHDRWGATLRAFGLVPLLLAGEPRKADRDALRRGDTHVVFATPGVFEYAIEWRRLGLVVALEEADHGEAARRVHAFRSPRPDLLVVAPTPVPASVLHGAYPSFDVSWGRADAAPAKGTVWSEGEREAAYHALGDTVKAGGTGLVVFPMKRGGTDLLTLRELSTLAATLQEQVLDGAEVRLFHGALTGPDRVRAWSDFMERRARVLVSTIPVELMPTSPRPVTALVEQADRIDLQRLLGIRALVGPEGHVHHVLGAEPSDAGRAMVEGCAAGHDDARLVSEAPDDAFRLAEGIETPVAPAFAHLRPARDVDVLVEARRVAHDLLTADPSLQSGDGPGLLRVAHADWKRLLPDVPAQLPSPRPASGGGSRRRRRRRRRR